MLRVKRLTFFTGSEFMQFYSPGLEFLGQKETEKAEKMNLKLCKWRACFSET